MSFFLLPTVQKFYVADVLNIDLAENFGAIQLKFMKFCVPINSRKYAVGYGCLLLNKDRESTAMVGNLYGFCIPRYT
jgi:hypothetical protein